METDSFWTGIPGILTALAGLIAAVGTLIGVLHSTGVLRRKAPDPPDPGTPSPAPIVEGTSGPSVAGAAETSASNSDARIVLRSAPAMLSAEKLSAMLVTRRFYDRRRNPAGAPASSVYDTRVDGHMLMVADHVTGLTWEMGGSDHAMTFDQAAHHVDQLNAARAGGYADWRLPTAEEVMSLMAPEAVSGFHIAPVFRREISFVWTADQVDADRAWVVYFADGSIEIEPKQFNAWVRAVR